MRQGSPAPYGAAAGAAGIVLFGAGTLVHRPCSWST
jgi:hypothetical protein